MPIQWIRNNYNNPVVWEALGRRLFNAAVIAGGLYVAGSTLAWPVKELTQKPYGKSRINGIVYQLSEEPRWVLPDVHELKVRFPNGQREEFIFNDDLEVLNYKVEGRGEKWNLDKSGLFGNIVEDRIDRTEENKDKLEEHIRNLLSQYYTYDDQEIQSPDLAKAMTNKGIKLGNFPMAIAHSFGSQNSSAQAPSQTQSTTQSNNLSKVANQLLNELKYDMGAIESLVGKRLYNGCLVANNASYDEKRLSIGCRLQGIEAILGLYDKSNLWDQQKTNVYKTNFKTLKDQMGQGIDIDEKDRLAVDFLKNLYEDIKANNESVEKEFENKLSNNQLDLNTSRIYTSAKAVLESKFHLIFKEFKETLFHLT